MRDFETSIPVSAVATFHVEFAEADEQASNALDRLDRLHFDNVPVRDRGRLISVLARETPTDSSRAHRRTGSRSLEVTSKGPTPSSASVQRRMSRQRVRDTQPELALRSELHRLGLRFRVDVPLPGIRRRADVLFRAARVIVLVDGCFWHACPKHPSWPKSNAAWWRRKLLSNRRRDQETTRALRRAGWYVVRVWEHESAVRAAARVARAVRSRAG